MSYDDDARWGCCGSDESSDWTASRRGVGKVRHTYGIAVNTITSGKGQAMQRDDVRQTNCVSKNGEICSGITKHQ